MNDLCSVDRCNNARVTHSWCIRCYDAWRNHRDPAWRSPTTEERFAVKVMSGDVPFRGSVCEVWTAHRDYGGYGRFKAAGREVQAHRWAYENEMGPISVGLHIDHLCRVRSCVNPLHLEPVTPGENARRGMTGQNNATKSHCPQGHEYAGDNLYVNPAGKRYCRTCRRDQDRQYRHKNRGRT